MPFFPKGLFTKDAKNKYLPALIPITGFFVYMWYERNYVMPTYRTFHNKSALYGGRDLKPGESIW